MSFNSIFLITQVLRFYEKRDSKPIWTEKIVNQQLSRSKILHPCLKSNASLLLWIIYVISVLICYASMHVCLLMPCGHLLGKGWPLASRLWYLIVTLSLSHWYPGSGVVLDCIDSWSLLSFLLWILGIMIYCHFNLCIRFYTVKNKYKLMPKEVAAERCHLFWCQLIFTFLLKEFELNISPVINVKIFIPVTAIVILRVNTIE